MSSLPSPVTSTLHSLSVSDRSPDPQTPPEPPPSPLPDPPHPNPDPDPSDIDTWGIPWSDEELEGSEPPGGWTPRPDEIRRLYEGIARAGLLPLRCVPRPRRPPSPEQRGPGPGGATAEPEQEGAGPAGSPGAELRHQEPPPPTEFDFDDDPLPPNPSLIDRRRTPGAPSRGQKREARLDKVLSDMKRHKKLEEQILRTGQDLFPPENGDSPTPKRPPGFFLRQRKY